MVMTCEEVIAASKGKLLSGNRNTNIINFSIDSRDVKPGDFFVPLVGENVDGHMYIEDALNKGAVGSFVGRNRPKVTFSDKIQIEVEEPLIALQETAYYHRKNNMIPLIAITGSAGKTTTKDLISSVLSTKYNVLKTKGNYNNHIGLPLMLLSLNKSHEIAVLEMGMSGLGEISLLTRLAIPQVGVITNIGEAHLEQVGDIEGVAKAKGELLKGLKQETCAVLNGDDFRIRKQAKNFKGSIVYYGFSNDNDYNIEDNFVQAEEGFAFKVHNNETSRVDKYFLPLLGKHNVLNSIAAIIIGERFSLNVEQINEGFSKIQLSGMRLSYREIKGVNIIDDTYNANPVSMRASLDILAEKKSKGKRIAVLGDMLELGKHSKEIHFDIGTYIAKKELDFLIVAGKYAIKMAEGAIADGMPIEKIEKVLTHQEAANILSKITNEGDLVLIKGSRGCKMEKILQLMTETP